MDRTIASSSEYGEATNWSKLSLTELPPGESKSRVFDLLASADADSCLPSGSVAFEETYAESVPSEEYTPDSREQRTVGFTLKIS